MYRILIAGASGYLGGYAVREFKERGYYIRALVRDPAGLSACRDAIDEVVTAQVTCPETLRHVCEGMDVVFSSIGITRQRDGLSFYDVDYRGNRNLLAAALAAGVKKFVYVSAFDGPALRHLDIADAHEAFADELAASGMSYTIVRPTGYYSDMEEFFRMAQAGRIWLIGSGKNRCNPIHGADLAGVCADAVESDTREISAGGPDTFTWNEVAALAFRVLDRPARITRIPGWLMWMLVRLVRMINHHQGELLAFFTTMSTRDIVAPATGIRTLEAHYRRLMEKETAATGEPTVGGVEKTILNERKT